MGLQNLWDCAIGCHQSLNASKISAHPSTGPILGALRISLPIFEISRLHSKSLMAFSAKSRIGELSLEIRKSLTIANDRFACKFSTAEVNDLVLQ